MKDCHASEIHQSPLNIDRALLWALPVGSYNRF